MEYVRLVRLSGWCAGLPLIFTTLSTAFAQVPANAPALRGSQIRINGRLHPGAWTAGTAIADGAWTNLLGGQLGNTVNPQQQPVEWFSTAPFTLPAAFDPQTGVRYLNIAAIAQQQGWQVQPQGTILNIQTPPARVTGIRVGKQAWGQRIVLDLDRPTPWTLSSLTNSRTGKTDRQFTINIDADLSSQLATFKAKPSSVLKSLSVKGTQGQVKLDGGIDGRFYPRIWSLANPPRLLVDLRVQPPAPRNITWAPGLAWREETWTVGSSQFPVTWLTVQPQRWALRPFWNSPTALVGTAPLATMAQRNQAIAAINAGFFNRKLQTTLGAIRRDGDWISSPILNRGAVAWTPTGSIKVGRLRLQETVQTSQGRQFVIVSSNSGYPQKGIARYTQLWGQLYQPLTDNERIWTVTGNTITSAQTASTGQSIPIPQGGALLVARAMPTLVGLEPGISVQHQASPFPAEFAAYPQIMGAGPLLIEQGQIVVDALAEKFDPTFAKQSADRSAIAQTNDGTIILAVTHNRVGGAGPTLQEWAQLLQKMGAVNALNLDGGSSTALYLGGRLIDRHPVTATKIQNGIGIFPRPESISN